MIAGPGSGETITGHLRGVQSECEYHHVADEETEARESDLKKTVFLAFSTSKVRTWYADFSFNASSQIL